MNNPARLEKDATGRFLGFIVKHAFFLVLIPWRIFEELVLVVFSWRKSPFASDSQPLSHIHVHEIKQEDRKKTMKAALKYWWNPESTDAGVLGRRKLSEQILYPAVVETYVKLLLKRNFTKDMVKARNVLLGARICDVRCGAGFLGERLTDAGAEAVGIDLDDARIMAARAHWKKTKDTITRPSYFCLSLEDLCRQSLSGFDIVVCSEPIDNSDVQVDKLAAYKTLLRPGGYLLFVGPSRGVLGFIFHILGLEHVTTRFPYGTQRLHRLTQSSKVAAIMERSGFRIFERFGFYPLGFNFAKLKFRKTKFDALWYGLICKSES